MLKDFNKKLLFYTISLLSLIIINSCGPSKQYLAGASAYEDEEQIWNPAYRIYHISKSVTRFYFIIPPGDILFKRNPETRKYEASAQISYHIIKPNGKTNTSVDKGSIEIKREEDEIPDDAIIGYFDVNINSDSFYYASIVLNDRYRKQQFEDIIPIDKKNKGSKENFIITDSTNRVQFLNFIDSNSKIKISSERLRSSTFFITRYYPIYNYPLPIYIEGQTERMDIVKDTTDIGKADEFITFERPGIYHIRQDTTSVNGLTLLNFYNGFPFLAQKENLAPPMRYITSDDEFNDLRANPDKAKLKTEKIWASMSNTLPKTENLLTTYYKRVQFANVYYTSYNEGWRTDRGLVYTIFGPPSNIYKNTREEQWVYGLENSSLSYDFSFKKAANPLTNNDYILERDSRKKEIWQKAVEYWRKGQIFGQKEIIQIQEDYERRNRNTNNYLYPSYYRGY